MLITTPEELRLLLPSSKITANDLKDFLPSIEEEEQTGLVPILGQELYDQINNTDYPELKSSILDPVKRSADTKAKIITICQRIAFFRMLANKASIFAVSFNRGAGLSKLSADSYEPASEKEIQEYNKAVWRTVCNSVETLLLTLERDARTDKTYTDLWKKSDYFYFHGDLLFSTAQEMKPFFPITDRSEYIKLIPDIRLVQISNIESRLGSDIVQRLISKKYTPASVPDASATVPDASATVPDESSSVITPVPDSSSASVTWHALRRLVLLALAQYLRSRNKNYDHHQSQGDGDLLLAQAEKLINDNRTIFYPEEQLPEEQEHHHHHHHTNPHRFNPLTDSVFDFGSIHID